MTGKRRSAGKRFAERILVLVLCISVAQSTAGRVVYVDDNAPGPTHDGSSWADAYKCLGDALAAADP